MKGFRRVLTVATMTMLVYGSAVAAISSPDGYGYVYRDGLTDGMISISGSGTAIAFIDSGFHDVSDKIPLGFSFEYYGTSYDSIYVMTCGWLSFVDRQASLPSESPFPQADNCEGVIAPLAISFEDPTVLFETQGIAPNRIFTVEWSGATTPDFEGFDFQIKFYEADNSMLVLYDNLADWNGESIDNCHVGIESPDETAGLEYYLGNFYDFPGAPTMWEAIAFGRMITMTSPFRDTTVIGSYTLGWNEICADSNAVVKLYYDDGTDTTGTLITDALTKQDADTYAWDISGLPLLTPVYVYAELITGSDTVISYAPGRITPDHGPLDSLAVTPATASVQMGSTLALSATAFDADKFSWDVTDTTGAAWGTDDAGVTVTAGSYTADSLGTYIVYITYGGLSDTCTVTVDRGPITGLTVTPGAAVITTDSTLQVTATANDDYSNTWDVTTTAVWGTDDASVSVADGSYDPDSTGTYIVYAVSGGYADTCAVTVNRGAAVSLSVSPSSQTLTADDSLILSVTAADGDGVKWDVTDTAATTWNASGSTSPLSNGVYFADTIGTWNIIAEYDGLRDTCIVTAGHGVIAALTVAPGSGSMTTDDSLQFTATAADADGNIWDATDSAATSWNTDEPSGAVTGGLYGPDVVGTYNVWATNSGQSDTGAVTVAHGVTVALAVAPATNGMTADDTLALTATAEDGDGNTWDVTDTVATVWTATGSQDAASGIYRADTTGTHYLVATYDGFKDTCIATVSHGAIASLAVTPDSSAMTTDDVLNVTATGTDSDGNTWDVTADAGGTTWRSDESGNLNLNDGTYEPAKPGDYRVYATNGAGSDTCFVAVAHGATDRVVLNPVSQSVTADDTVSFSLRAYDADGNFWDIVDSSGTVWSAPGSKSSIAGGVYYADTVGIWSITAAYAGSADTSTVTVTHGALATFDVTPDDDTITTDDTLQFAATGSDADGNSWDLTATASWQAGGAAAMAMVAGRFDPAVDGAYYVRAASGAFVDTSTVEVLNGAPVRIVLLPASVTVTADDTVAFALSAYDADNNGWDVTADAGTGWQATGSAGTVTDGVYRADTAGSHLVVGQYAGFADTAAVTVSHGAVFSLDVFCNLDTVLVNDTARCTATASDADGNLWDVTGDTAWTAEGPAARNFLDGKFVPDVTGTYIVFTSSEGVADTVLLYVDPSVPVELSSFSAAVTAAGVVLAWTTETETDNLGFNVLRGADAAGPFHKVNGSIIPGAGTVTEPHTYVYTDTDAAGTVYYVLEQVDYDGTKSLSGVVAVEAGVSAIELPVNTFQNVHADIRVFDMAGRPVRVTGTGVYLIDVDGMLVKKLILK